MSHNCKKCQSSFKEGKDGVVICRFHEGAVHLGCCINSCSWDQQPCENADAILQKIS